MPNARTPSFRQLADGMYMTKWGGRHHYFGKDRARAYERYLDSLDEWRQWRQAVVESRRITPARAVTFHELAGLRCD